MRRRFLELVAVILLAWLIARAHGESFALRVLQVDKGTFSAVPVRPATLVFDVQEGKAPEKGEVLVCKQDAQVHSFGDHSDSFLVLRCHEQSAILRGVFFQ